MKNIKKIKLLLFFLHSWNFSFFYNNLYLFIFVFVSFIKKDGEEGDER